MNDQYKPPTSQLHQCFFISCKTLLLLLGYTKSLVVFSVFMSRFRTQTLVSGLWTSS